FSRWIPGPYIKISCAVFSLLLFLSHIGFVVQLRTQFPVLEESKVKILASLEGTGILSYLNDFKVGLYRWVENGNPTPPAPSQKEESVGVMLARPEPPAPPQTAPPAIDAEADPKETSSASPERDIPSLYWEAKEDYN